jgi:TPP-dependent pyruvate/acetoin dehydrogenase alpha subunit
MTAMEAFDRTGTGLDPALELRLYREMTRIRMIEEEIAARYAEQKMRCPVHLSVGQEAVPVGISAALRKSDQVVSTHRCHSHYLAKGGDLNAMLCEIMGREAGCCGGRGGSMHLFDVNVGMLLSLPIVGASIPVGVGAAMACKQRGDDNVAVIYLGDASVEEGVFHESANFAAVQKLPAIFVCENNLYSVYTPLRDRQPARPITDLARGHGLHSVQVDGNDVVAVYDVAREMIARARSGGGPSFILADTYRWREHCGPNYDNTLGYRTIAEFETWKSQEPIDKLVRVMERKGILDPAKRQAIAAECAAEIATAFEFAESAPFPKAETAGQMLYAD